MQLLATAHAGCRILFRRPGLRKRKPTAAPNPSIGGRSYAAECNMLAQLTVTAQNVCQFHVMRCAAFRREEAGTAYDDASAMSARGCNVEAIEIVEEFHASRRIL